MVAFVQAIGGGPDPAFVPLPVTLTLPVAPTPANFLVLVGLGSQSVDTFDYTLPAGWTIDYQLGQSGHSGLSNLLIARHVVGPADGPSVVLSAPSIIGGSGGYLLAEYSGMGGAPLLLGTLDQGFVLDNAPVVAGPFTPPADREALIVLLATRHPNYAIGAPVGGSGFTNRQEANQGGSRQTVALLDLIVGNTAGSYTAELQAHSDDEWRVPFAAYQPAGGVGFPPGYW